MKRGVLLSGLLGLLGALVGPAAQASYINTCILHGTVASAPQRSQAGLWTFDFTVQAAGAARDGRVDGSCKNHEKQISVSLAIKDAKLGLAQGQSLWLRELYKSGKGGSPMRLFSLLRDKEGQSLMNPER